MSDFKPTASQQAAIELRGSTALISAGAGSGKTKVLTERLMHYVLDPHSPADIDSFLIITFTRPAAGELRGRIMDALSDALARDPGNKRLRRQSALCSKAQISTIHSFCSNLIKENAQALGITPDFKIVDDERAAQMKIAALGRTLEERYSAQNNYPGFKALADTVGVGRDDRRLAELTLSLYEKMQSHARPELWAREQKELMKENHSDVAETLWGQELMQWAGSRVRYWEYRLNDILGEMQSCPTVLKAYGSVMGQLADKVGELSRALSTGWDRARDCLPITVEGRMGSVRKTDPNAAFAAEAKAVKDDCVNDLKKLAGTFYSNSAQLVREMQAAAPAMCALLDLVLDFDDEYSKAKRRAGLLDYADLEHITAKLLTNEDGSPSELAVSVSQRYTEIMVDEYQDVSRVQDTIFHAVSRAGHNLFMVGDIKQSIYRFRLADPEIFTEKYNSFKNHEDADTGESRRILLRENFRSRREIIDCANAVFSNCMSAELGDIDYDDNAALKFGAEYYSGTVPKPELMLLHLPKAEDGEERPDKLECEARMVALKIKSLVEGGETVFDSGGERPMSYGDIAIIARSANQIAGIYRRVLTQHGVPVVSGQGGGFYSSIEVSAVMSMLAVIDNPHQDIPLIAVLRSPAFGFTADELSNIRALSTHGDFYSALCLDESEHSRGFIEKLRVMRDIAAEMSPPELLWHIYNELDMLALCSAMADGEQRRRNLLALLQLSEKFNATGFKGLHRFVLWLRRLADKGNEPAVGAADGSAVQIISTHKSKGLEFPVVFYVDTARDFNLTDNRSAVLVHPTLGLGPKVTDLVRRVEYPTLARNAISRRIRIETYSEEMRLLYVALTRPKERLYITAALKDPDKLISKCETRVSSPMSPEVLYDAQNPATWLVYAALADKEEHLRIRYCEDESASVEAADLAKPESADEAQTGMIEKLLSFTYPHTEAETLPSKVTATELKTYAEPDPDAESIAPAQERKFNMPDFAKKDKPLTGTERGIATHLVLQYMDFGRTDSLDAVQEEIDRLYSRKFITEREREAVDAKAIYKLFSSPLGARMKNADSLTREFKFSLLCDAGELFGADTGDEVLLQGVVDCCIEEKSELTIIDYKTDSIFGDGVDERAAVYAPQVRAYAAALERIFKKPVKDCVLYFLRASKAVEIKLK